MRRIFASFSGGMGIYAIAEMLTREGIPCPSAHDPARNRHRCGIAWNKFAVRAILANPRYTGHQVWNRQRKDEVLLDVDDVALGHTTKLRWNETGQWVWSEQIVHPPIIDRDAFNHVQALLGGRASKPAEHKPHRARRPYALCGCLWCGICERRMQSHWANCAPGLDILGERQPGHFSGSVPVLRTDHAAMPGPPPTSCWQCRQPGGVRPPSR